MKESLLHQMRQLSRYGYQFVRVTGYYQPEQLLVDEIDSQLDTVANTPAFQKITPVQSQKRVFLLVLNPVGGVVATIWLNGRHSESVLERWCWREIKKLK